MKGFGRRELFKGAAAAAVAGALSPDAAEARSDKRLERTAIEYIGEATKLDRHWRPIVASLREDFVSSKDAADLREKYQDYDDMIEIADEIIVVLDEINTLLAEFAAADSEEKANIINRCRELFDKHNELSEEITKISDYQNWLEEHQSEPEEPEQTDT